MAWLHIWFVLVLMAFVGASALASNSELSINHDDDGVTINIGGKLFTRYITKSGRRPVLWPVIGPTGEPMTRVYPMGEGSADEARDHIHHRSVWLGYEGINGVDFWHEPGSGDKPFPFGEQRHREFARVECDGSMATIVTTNDWLDPDGKKVCEDERTWTFGTDGDARWLDCRLVLTASEGELRFADSKEGFLAVRVAHSMNVDNKLGGKIVSSRGLTDGAAWAQPAEWVDYHGPLKGEKAGIAMFAHPETFNFPPAWHVRTYGLFAANPLAKLAFTDTDSDIRERPLRMTLAKGESLVLHYRIVLHRGDEKAARLADRYAEYIVE